MTRVRILLIDDEAFVLQLLAAQLASLGYDNLELCEHAVDALALINTDAAAVDMIFCDLNMPGMDGVEFVRHLVGTGYSGGLVLVSGVSDRILQSVYKLAAGHRLQVLGALPKPVSLEQLQQVLALKQSVRARPAQEVAATFAPEELQQAISEQQYVLHSQPKVSVSNGNLAGMEALVRWNHPQHGLIGPNRFIPVAEECGMIDAITQYVLGAALRQSRIWSDAGFDLHVAVNVSMDDLGELGFPEMIAGAASDAGVSPSSLTLEVTESRIMKNPVIALDILARLRLRQIGLSIDDFGTGHSTLAQLRDIPFDELKVDKGFVHNAGSDAALAAIFEASLKMARQLDMRTVAEGVETRADWDYLRDSGCDLAQGYFIARPMPASDLPAWLEQWQGRRADLLGGR
jgi:EAL domain-containing protein (putative c-di-GMP-specific phosphodiesterase class I)